MTYRIAADLKSRLKTADLNYRDFGNLVNESPTVVGQRLNGFMPLTDEKRAEWLKILDKLENQKSETVRG